ncbi:MAG: PilZ domain-containing protein [Candidatus Omnitrophica bacterium]|nr:PilZ domain-containing protein [Candidatus Omnitrophota bacterium]MBU1851183.1 PilZ domain-containing protein [Candidatus Omnitrophota bacterium]
MEKVYLDIKYENGKHGRGYIADISNSGIGLASTEKIAVDTAIEMVARNGELIPLKGKVVYTRDKDRESYRYGLGVKFDVLDEAEKWNLSNFLHKKNKRTVPRFP